MTPKECLAIAGELFANAAAETRPEKRALLQALADHYTAIADESRRHTVTQTLSLPQPVGESLETVTGGNPAEATG